jgi:uncharacterized protein YdeI (YjbR/CyaY-like superfamily)
MRGMSEPTYFDTPAALRRWLAKHHASADELWVGYWKKSTGVASVTWPETVDEALCVGWIDGIRKSVDAERYKIRFTPRRAGSHWSAVNLRRVAVLIEEGRMRPSGLAAYEARDPAKSGRYSFEQEKAAFTAAQRKRFQADPDAWAFFQSQPPGYRRTATWWVISAKRDDTRDRRLATLIADSAAGRRIKQLRR